MKNRLTFLCKPVLTAVMTVALLLGCIGCGTDGKQKDTTPTTESPIATTKPITQEITTEPTTQEETTEPTSPSVSYEDRLLRGILLDIGSDYVVVEPLKGEPEYGSTIHFHVPDHNLSHGDWGCFLEIDYIKKLVDGEKPSFIVTNLIMLDDPNRQLYNSWINDQTAEPVEACSYRDVTILRIFPEFFLARALDDSDTMMKLNGRLGDTWCVRDQATVTFDSGFYDPETNRIEGRLVDIEEIPMAVPEKPVIYLYPEETTQVSVKLKLEGRLTCTYPAYKEGWTVTADPDGTLTDKAGMQYNYLYWEGITDRSFDLSHGFCVKGADTAAFLEDALAKLGLNRKEANEFIVYWLPMMENNPYNIISFRQEDYTEAAKLDISPEPDTLIRVFMAWRSSDCLVPMEAQNLTSPERKGFTVIEWGGAQMP